jgi:hypothetical protein
MYLSLQRYVNYTEWPHSEAYPPYCNGWVYALRPTTASKLASAASTTPFNHIDDLFVTGIIRHRSNYYIYIIFIDFRFFYVRNED